MFPVSQEDTWARRVQSAGDMATIQDVREITRCTEPLMGDYREVRYKYNDRYGTAVNLATNRDVVLMMNEWRICHDAFIRSRHSMLPRMERVYGPVKPALDLFCGLRAEIHVYPSMANSALLAAARLITAGTMAATNEADQIDVTSVSAEGDEPF